MMLFMDGRKCDGNPDNDNILQWINLESSRHPSKLNVCFNLQNGSFDATQELTAL